MRVVLDRRNLNCHLREVWHLIYRGVADTLIWILRSTPKQVAEASRQIPASTLRTRSQRQCCSQPMKPLLPTVSTVAHAIWAAYLLVTILASLNRHILHKRDCANERKRAWYIIIHFILSSQTFAFSILEQVSVPAGNWASYFGVSMVTFSAVFCELWNIFVTHWPDGIVSVGTKRTWLLLCVTLTGKSIKNFFSVFRRQDHVFVV